MSQNTMNHSSVGRIWGKLPVDIMERVLSFLSVPVLCRMRSVCKTWNELIGKPSYHDLRDRNGGNNQVYMFMWGDDWYGHRVAVAPGGTFSFLDLEEGRWYSIQATEIPRVSDCGSELETRLMAMGDGLICELTTFRGTERNLALTLSDPVVRTRRTLPAPPKFYSRGDASPKLVIVVDDVTRSYKVFLVNLDRYSAHEDAELPRIYVHESFTNEWRGLRNLPVEMKQIWVFSTVGLYKTVFTAGASFREYGYDQVTLFRQKLEEGDAWAKVWQMSFRRSLRSSELVVSDNRLFVIVWSAFNSRRLYPDSNCPNSESLFQTNQDYPKMLFEMYEILISENGRKPVVQLTSAQLEQIFRMHGHYGSNIRRGFLALTPMGGTSLLY